MRLPQPQFESTCFLFDGPAELISALGSECSSQEAGEIYRLCELGLPPVTSIAALSVMLGYNPGFVWSIVNKAERHYRHFEIPKGKNVRKIQAPRVALKAIQKWLSYHLQKTWKPRDSVYGFVPGRSHVGAAMQHLSARWVYSIDIENFFPSTSAERVFRAYQSAGYADAVSLGIVTRLSCYKGVLAQGAPTSPVLSNIVLTQVDEALDELARDSGLTYTRYADDIVFSGKADADRAILEKVKSIVVSDGWTLSERKEEFSVLPNRLKVHGLLVHGLSVRLTKGYRNRIRAFRHLLERGKVKIDDIAKISGHINYAKFIEDAHSDGRLNPTIITEK